MTQDDALAIQSQEELFALAKRVSASGVFQDGGDENRALVKIMAGREMGFPTIASMSGVYIIQTKQGTSLALSATLMRSAMESRKHLRIKTIELTNTVCKLELWTNAYGEWELVGPSKFTIEDANLAGLVRFSKNGRTGKFDVPGNWHKYPRNMLISRATANLARWFGSEVFLGPVYTPEELGADVDEQGAPLKEADVVVGRDVEELKRKLNEMEERTAVGNEDGAKSPEAEAAARALLKKTAANAKDALDARDRAVEDEEEKPASLKDRRYATLNRLEELHRDLNSGGSWKLAVHTLNEEVGASSVKIADRPLEQLERLIALCEELSS